MIEPVQLNLYSRLEPVEVPHFKGAAKAKKYGDNFDTFKKKAKETTDTTKKGAVKGLKALGNFGKKTVEFTGALVKSVCEDLAGVAKGKGANAVSQITDLI